MPAFQKPIYSGLPPWLSSLIAIAIITSGITVSIFAFLTIETILNRPLNPIVNAAENVADVNLPPLAQDGPAPLLATLSPTELTPTPLPTQEPWQGNNRITILLMGIDRRPGEPFVSRTDTMMLVSYDPNDDSAVILSIPRDLYVVIPGIGRDRINTALVRGARGKDPAAGAALAMQTVSYNLGINVDHYVMVDFNAVTRSIDTLGGIDVDVPFEISDPTYPDMNYGYDPLYIPAGWQHFDGEMALKYARTRHVDNDFGRAQRQQQVILSVREKALSYTPADMLNIGVKLWGAMNESVRTDMSLRQIQQLMASAGNISDENIQHAVLDYNYVTDHRTNSGASVLVLINERAALLIEELFY